LTIEGFSANILMLSRRWLICVSPPTLWDNQRIGEKTHDIVIAFRLFFNCPVKKLWQKHQL